MKSFKETFELIALTIHNLEGSIKTYQYCIDNNMNIELHKNNLKAAQKRLEALKLQDYQLRDLIINDKS